MFRLVIKQNFILLSYNRDKWADHQTGHYVGVWTLGLTLVSMFSLEITQEFILLFYNRNKWTDHQTGHCVSLDTQHKLGKYV